MPAFAQLSSVSALSANHFDMTGLKTYIVEDSKVIRESLIATLEELGPVQVVGTAEDEATAVRWGLAPDEETLRLMHTCVAEARGFRDQQDWDGVALANQNFHRAIASLTRSERTTAWFASLLAQLRLVFARIADRSFHATYIDDNARVLAALESGDREAATRCLVDYLERARDDVLARLTV